MSVPRLVVAAPSSGAGKTTVATGLMAALAARGLAVAPFKVGPDYIDPGYHALATGRPGRNLDPVLVGEQLVAPLFAHGASGADVAVVEGVMGLFDGRAASDEGSTAHVARLLDAPVVLVVDASAQSRSVAALVQGFTRYDPRVRVAGVVLNRVGSERHEALLREALDGVAPVLGVLHRDAEVAVPSRHLGLVPVAERAPEAVASVRRLGSLCERALDLDTLVALARSAPAMFATPWEPGAVVEPVPGRPVVAVASGPAFSFSYAETTELLDAAGADVVPFDPLRDRLPERTAGVLLGGGFPEMHAAQLAANQPLLHGLRRFDGAVYAECAGLLYLCRSLDGQPLVGHWDAEAKLNSRLVLGYRDAIAAVDTVVARAGERVRGHEFHYTVTSPGAGVRPAWEWDGQGHGFATGTRVLGSYLHVHWAGYPRMASRFVTQAAFPRAAA